MHIKNIIANRGGREPIRRCGYTIIEVKMTSVDSYGYSIMHFCVVLLVPLCLPENQNRPLTYFLFKTVTVLFKICHCGVLVIIFL